MNRREHVHAAPDEPLPLQRGDVVGGYCVERLIATGGSGAVFAARHLASDHPAALKLLLSNARKDPELVGRFVREAQTAALLESEHVARVFAAGELPSGAPYIVFEYLEGGDLADLLHVRGTLDVPEAVQYVVQACKAIAEAHALGIVHRDIKPENLFLTRRAEGAPLIKVIDFGISKLIDPSWVGTELALTESQTVMGSPMYMAPEQLRSARSADTRSDIWSLGIVLYELLAGRGPFEATTLAELCAAVLKEDPIPLGRLRPDLPPALEAAVMRCLQKAPADRFDGALDLAHALDPFIGAPVSASSHSGAAGGPTPLPPGGGSSIPPVTSGRRSAPSLTAWNGGGPARRGRALGRRALGGALIFGIAALLTAWFLREHPIEASMAAEAGLGSTTEWLSDRAEAAAQEVDAELKRQAEPVAPPPSRSPSPARFPQQGRPRKPGNAAPAPGYNVPLYGRD